MLLIATVLLFSNYVNGLTDNEIDAFGVGEHHCLIDDVTTSGKRFCACIDIENDGSTTTIITNSVPSHGYHKG